MGRPSRLSGYALGDNSCESLGFDSGDLACADCAIGSLGSDASIDFDLAPGQTRYLVVTTWSAERDMEWTTTVTER